MFMDEFTPVFQEFARQPLSFMGGFFSGVFRLNLKDDPVKSWLDQQTGTTSFNSSPDTNNGKSGPQSISID